MADSRRQNIGLYDLIKKNEFDTHIFVPHYRAKRRTWKYPLSVNASCVHDNLKNRSSIHFHFSVWLYLG